MRNRLNVTSVVGLSMACALTSAFGAVRPSTGLAPIGVGPTNVSSMLGVADWNAHYAGQSSLLMGANDSKTLGVKNLMVALGPNFNNPNQPDYVGTDFSAPTAADLAAGRSTHAINGLADEASSKPFQNVFSMPFQTYAIDASPITIPDFLNPSNPSTEYQTLYTEYYNLAKYLIQTYQGTGKTFILKNWEGDNAFYYENAQTAPHPSVATQIQNMRTYLQARHDAVEDARQDFAADGGVTVEDAIEINRVGCARQGVTPCMLKDVVPYVQSDMISYSSYETINTGVQNDNLAGQISQDFSYIKNYPGVNGRPLIVGEFGFGSNAFGSDPAKAAQGAADATATAVAAFAKAGVPYAFDWQIKDSGGADQTLGLIDANGNRTDSWDTVHNLVASWNALGISIPSNTGGFQPILRRGTVPGSSVTSVNHPLVSRAIVSHAPNAYVPLSENVPQLTTNLQRASLSDMTAISAATSGHLTQAGDQ